jgi:hypothetical protein
MTEFLALLQTAVWPVLLVVFFWPFRKAFDGLSPEKIAQALSKVQKGKVAVPGGALEWELQGGFNRSSQHPVSGVVEHDGQTEVGALYAA